MTVKLSYDTTTEDMLSKECNKRQATWETEKNKYNNVTKEDKEAKTEYEKAETYHNNVTAKDVTISAQKINEAKERLDDAKRVMNEKKNEIEKMEKEDSPMNLAEAEYDKIDKLRTFFWVDQDYELKSASPYQVRIKDGLVFLEVK